MLLNLLHARGGVSIAQGLSMIRCKSSPRTWRCFFFRSLYRPCFRIFSTHVEVFLKQNYLKRYGCHLLHARGGVSPMRPFFFSRLRSSPRTWRCFSLDELQREAMNIFSTHVEVFLWLFGVLRSD